jgi:hypothetical protein
VTLIASAGVCIVLIKGEKLKDRLKAALIFSIIAIVPLLTWIIGHNYMKHQTIFGPRDYARLPWNNLIDSTEKVLNWFYPFYTVQGILPYLNLAGIGMIVITLIVLNKKSDWLAWGRTLSGPFVLPGAVFLVVYALVLSFTVNYAEHKYPGYDRFEIVILPVMLPLIFITLQKLIQPKSRVVNGVLSILFILSFGYAVQGSYEYVTASHGNGVVEYNMYNFPPIQDSPTTQKMKELALANPEAALYSNNPAVIWFVTRREVLMPPLWEKKRKFDESAKQQLKGWPGEDGYLAWFIPDIYEIFATPEELSRVANVELIYRTPNGEIYSVRSIGD